MSIESVILSNHLILFHPLLLLPPIPPSIRVFSNESTLRMRWPKYWSFNFSISPSNEYPGLIFFRIDWLDLLAVGLVSVIVFLIVDWLFFISSQSLLCISCILSVHASSLFIPASVLFSRFWIIFTISILNSYSGRLPIVSSFVWSGRFLLYSVTCWVFLCIFILFSLLHLRPPFCKLECPSSSQLWSLLSLGGIGQVLCEGFLVGGTCAYVLVDGAESCLSRGQCSVQ